ncbi:energy-coupling factor transporter transmembrane component T family protein [Paenibacillus assamensis]|uniref:energy-coupling factor transporter transmembrane component T family protein n=1 Tax=Paenibacillus assamensis TaxID=311244 RepID=UPI0004178C4E|nr:energy-coupling factor transporter transmembrane component T [Paenibacillus assamensis]
MIRSSKLVMGRYIDASSWVHRLDPRAKLVAMLLFLAAVISAHSIVELIAITAIALLILASSGIPLSRFGRASKPLWPLMFFMFLFYTLFEQGGSVWFEIGSFQVSREGILLGLSAVWRMLLLVCFTSILTFTTTTIELNLGLEAVLKPLKLVGVSPQQWTMMITIALRFIPTIFEEADRILKAQASRGADINDLKFAAKGKMLLTLLIPIIVGAFRRAEDLVHAMESRGYVLDRARTSLRMLKWRRIDSLFLIGFAAMLVFTFVM